MPARRIVARSERRGGGEVEGAVVEQEGGEDVGAGLVRGALVPLGGEVSCGAGEAVVGGVGEGCG
ncbi:MAG: hypothetical protein ACRDQ0_12325 [Pseudonocardia sp.]